MSEIVSERSGEIQRNCFVYPPFQITWFRYCYMKHPRDDFTKVGKDTGDDWEGGLEGRYQNKITGDHMLNHFQSGL